jgi:plasmid maintenance system antidote protein VapI
VGPAWYFRQNPRFWLYSQGKYDLAKAERARWLDVEVVPTG